MGLSEYHRKRDFGKTPEPRGEVRPGEGRAFCIQKHAATRLHYDFRLEMEGVLKSWAVPKGPSHDPAEKRLAMRTEDHPVDYGDFEGVIPRGEYGGGTVLLWDRGTWEPLGDPLKDLAKGSLKFVLHGEKLQGRWTLVKIKSRDPREAEKTWLLIKERDEMVRPAAAYDVTEARPESVASGRLLDEIARDRDRVWHPGRGEGAAAPAVEGARRGPLPTEVEPALPSPARKVPEDAGWVHELAYEGCRILARVEGGEVRLVDAQGEDRTARFPAVARACRSLPVSAAILDGMVVAFLPSGLTSAEALEASADGSASATLAYLVFDLLHRDGLDLSPTPLLARKQALAALLRGAPAPLRYADHVAGSGEAFLSAARGLGARGVVSKRAGAPYRPGRTRDWRYVACAAPKGGR